MQKNRNREENTGAAYGNPAMGTAVIGFINNMILNRKPGSRIEELGLKPACLRQACLKAEGRQIDQVQHSCKG